MEKIKVNMSPNPLDVQTIHASQNDGEARQWEFELHNNGELIDTSDVTEQLVFKAYKGGTEQILPENGSTPTTSPFLGDIKYPQGLLSDQEFLYRQSPTEEDGLAWIKNIKGNTLVWNQLVQNGNFESASGWSGVRGTISVSNSICSYTITEVGSIATGNRLNRNSVLSNNHNYLISCEVKAPYNNVINASTSNNESLVALSPPPTPNVWTRVSGFMTKNSTYDSLFIGFDASSNYSVGDVVQFRNVMVIDLTQMGLDISSPSEFTSLFPLSYYAYNQGTLLSFNGNGIKTTGKNLLKTNISSETINGVTFTVNKDENGELTEIIVSGTATQRANLYVLPQGTNNVLSTGRYILSAGFNSQNIYMSSYNTTTELSYRDYGSGVEVPYVTGEDYSIYISVLAGATANNIIFKPMLRLIDVEDSTFEPYTSSTLSLPISTYFPNGMDGVGTDYDELTNTKATTRMARVDLGTLDYIYEPQNTRFYTSGLANAIKKQGQYDLPNIIVPNYTVRYVYQISAENNMSVGVSNTSGAVFFSNANYTSGNDFKTAMSGVYLVYPLATPIETSFTTASLVTENAEIPLSNNDGTLIGKCTEELSAEPGFHDAKIKLSDSNGECYSNKIQLHVERSPQ